MLFSETQIGNEDIFETTSKLRKIFVCFLHCALSTPMRLKITATNLPRRWRKKKFHQTWTWHKTQDIVITVIPSKFDIHREQAKDGKKNIKLIASHQFPIINRRKKTEKVDAKQFLLQQIFLYILRLFFSGLFFGVTGSIKSNHHRRQKREKNLFDKNLSL